MNPFPLIEFNSVSRTYKSQGKAREVKAVDDITFHLQQGEVYGLVGPNGSGKSTAMKMLLGLVKIEAGFIKINQEDIHQQDQRHLFGYLPENPYFSGYLSGEETLSYYARLSGVELNKKALIAKVEEVATQVGILSALKQSVKNYSKGMLQRLGLAQALIHDPEVLVLDEPTAGVDPRGAHEIREIILKLKAEGKTILMCSHLLNQVEEVCDRVGVMHQGRILAEGTLSELLIKEDQYEVTLKKQGSLSEEEIEQAWAQQDFSVFNLESITPKRQTLESLFLELTKDKSA